MYRVLPQRWWSILTLVIVFGIIGAAVSVRIARRFVVADVEFWAVIGVITGVIVGLLIMLVSVAHDTRLLAVRDMLSGAIVVQAVKDDTFTSWLPYISELPASQLAVKRLFTVAFDRSGATFWTGSRVPLKIAAIPWKDIKEFELGPLKPKAGFGQEAYYRLRLVVGHNEELSTVQFGVEPTPGKLRARLYMSEAELVDLVERANVIRRGGATAISAPVSHLSAGLVPGRTAWAAQRFTVGSPFAKMGAIQVLFLAGIAAILLKQPIWVTWVLIGLAFVVLALLGLSVRLMRDASAREKAAGYTTLNGVDLAVEQRHPKTGVVIRTANTSPLTQKQFASLLKR